MTTLRKIEGRIRIKEVWKKEMNKKGKVFKRNNMKNLKSTNLKILMKTKNINKVNTHKIMKQISISQN